VKVAVVGASPNPERYAHRALIMLRDAGHHVVPVHPAHATIEGLPVTPSLADLPPGDIDTVTLYLGPDRSNALRDDLLRLRPRRVLFNPGAENPALAANLQSAGIATEEACTLVLLRTGAF
jgi:predicted CoA-binding protein